MTYPGPNPYGLPPQQPQRKRWSRGQKLALWIPVSLAGVLVVLACAGGLMNVATTPPKAAAVHAVAPAAEATAAAPEPTSTLTVSDVTLQLKITSKQCFGSAGCNLEYTVKAGWPNDTVADSCDVTYEVSGVQDGPAVNTLTIESDGTYEHQTSEFASTARKSDKLRVKATEVECND